MPLVVDVWKTGIDVCKSKGYTFTAELMKHARYGDGSTLTYYNDS